MLANGKEGSTTFFGRTDKSSIIQSEATISIPTYVCILANVWIVCCVVGDKISQRCWDSSSSSGMYTHSQFYRITFSRNHVIKKKPEKVLLLPPSRSSDINWWWYTSVWSSVYRAIQYIARRDFFLSIEIKQAKNIFFFVAFWIK